MGAILADGNIFAKRCRPYLRHTAKGKSIDEPLPTCATRSASCGPPTWAPYGPMKYALSLMMGSRQTYQRPPHPDVTEEQKTRSGQGGRTQAYGGRRPDA